MIGAHDTATANKPRHWWGWLTLPISRCQTRSIKELYDNGVRCFDLRVTFNKDEAPIYKHGIVKFKGDPIDDMATIDGFKDCAIRIILEDTKRIERHEKLFMDLCDWAEGFFLNTRFFGGNRRVDWKQVYDFKYKPTLLQLVGSMAQDARWYERIFPRLYANRMNDKNMTREDEADIVLYDFL